MLTIATDGGTVRTTLYHPFWVVDGWDLDERSTPRELAVDEDEGLSLSGRWVNSHELRVGDSLIGADGQLRTVLKFEQELHSNFPVHNLTIAEDHTFAVGPDGILVHNTGGCLDEAIKRGMRVIQGLDAPDRFVEVLEKIGRPMTRVEVGDLIHRVKDKLTIAAAEDLSFDYSEGLWDSRTGEYLGKAWEW